MWVCIAIFGVFRIYVIGGGELKITNENEDNREVVDVYKCLWG